ncbi:MAG: RimK family alpha-L-glutamate ligase [Candidatus ainarchaeum sp.]|nr:RimK family alpha-L-glutamate ligase [Candidatus ainarchaeum sp.]
MSSKKIKIEKKFALKEKMSIVIIGSKKFKQSTVNAMISEAQEVFDKAMFVTIDKIQIITTEKGLTLKYKDQNLLTDYDVIYPRFSSNDFLLGEAILKAIETSKAYNPLNLKSFQITNHKYYTSQKLSKEGVPGILSTLLISPKYIDLVIKEIGYPIVMKLISGFAGKGVVLVKDKGQMNSLLDTVHLFEECICMQKFVKSKNPGTDVRCYVTGDEVTGIMRIAKKGDWRSNLSRGGSAKIIEMTQEIKKIALTSAKILNMDICAIDLMDNNGKYVVIEVNFMPGPFKKYIGNLMIKKWIKFLYKKGIENKKKIK